CAGARRRAIVATSMQMFTHLGPALAATVILLGCGSGETPGVAGGAAKPAAAPRKVEPGGVDSANLVRAGGGPHPGPAAVQLKFELRERPDVARPRDIDVVILPAS